MHQTTTHGLRTLWLDGPPPYSAALVIGVGGADETLPTTGITHVVEHLVMGSLPKQALDRNARVDALSTVFHATGRVEDVTEFLAGVCTALSDLPLERLATEQKVLTAEHGQHEHPALGWAATVLHGAEGIGLVGGDGPPATALGADRVRQHVRDWFTADNAVLVCTGPPPTDPRITLPSGTTPARTRVRHRGPQLPALLTEVPQVVLACHGPTGVEMVLTMELLRERIEDEARHRLGLTYEVGLDGVPFEPGRTLSAIWCDAASENHAQVARVALDAWRDLAAQGPRPEELAHAVASLRSFLADPRSQVDQLVSSALRWLRDEPVLSAEQRLAEIEAVQPEALRALAAQTVSGVLIGLDESPEDPIPGVPDRSEEVPPDAAPVAGTSYRRRLLSLAAPRDLEVVVGEQGITAFFLGHRVGGPWAEVAGVGVDGGSRVVTMRDGRQFLVVARDLKRGEEAVAALDRYAGGLLYEHEGVVDGLADL